jgi:hypothetical protein
VAERNPSQRHDSLLPLHRLRGRLWRVVVKISDIHNSLGKVKIGLWKSEDGFLKK